MIREAVLKEQSPPRPRRPSAIAISKVIDYLMKKRNSAVDQSEFYEIEAHIKAMKKLAAQLDK